MYNEQRETRRNRQQRISMATLARTFEDVDANMATIGEDETTCF